MDKKFDNFAEAKTAATENPGSILASNSDGTGWTVKGPPKEQTSKADVKATKDCFLELLDRGVF